MIENGKAKFSIPEDVNFSIVIDNYSYVEDVSAGAASYVTYENIEEKRHIGIIVVIPMIGVLASILKKKKFAK